MRYLLLLACIFFIPTISFARIDYQLDIELQPERQHLTGTARINLQKSRNNVQSFQLAQNCKVDSVTRSGVPQDYSFAAGNIELDAAQRSNIEIKYRCIFKDEVAANPLHNEDPSYGIAASISAAGAYLSAAANWYPRLDSQQVNYHIQISAPAGFEAITSGQRTFHANNNTQSSSHWLVDYPLRGLTLSAGHYQLFEDLNGTVPIYAYFYADTAPLAANYLQQARNYLNLYTELFGRYPFHKFAIVENFFPTGYGFPSWTLLGSSVIKLPFIVETSLGHEIAHSWWGTGVQVDYSQGNWAEGLTTYVADYLYKERSSAADARDYRLKILRDYASLVNPENVFPIAAFSARHNKASQAIGYGKTALLFHMLRQKVGESVFWSGLRKMTAERMFSPVGWDDFAEIFSTVSDQDLRPFFRQWLDATAGPQLWLQDVKQLKTVNGWQVTGTLQQNSAYQLNIELQLQTETEVLSQQLQVDSASTVFSFDSLSRPMTLQADPAADLFRVLAAEEIPASVNSIRGSNQLLVLRAAKDAPDETAIVTLLGAMRKSTLPVQTFHETSADELANHDLLIFGLPADFAPAGLKNIFKEQSVRQPEQSLFVVERNPLNMKKNCAWFIGTAQQAAVVARKIPHYGKYSFLRFNAGKNHQKQIWTPTNSPLRVEFD